MKSRAWDKYQLEMIEDAGLRIDGDGRVWTHELSSGAYLLNVHVFPMLYTGQKDKNGIEIFEGDLIHGPEYPVTATVVYDESTAAFKAQHGTKLIPLGYECRVIGNIYEPPNGTENKKGN